MYCTEKRTKEEKGPFTAAVVHADDCYYTPQGQRDLLSLNK